MNLPGLLPTFLRASARLLLAACAASAFPVAAAKLEPDENEQYLEAMQMIGEGRNTDAIETLSRLIERHPLHAGSWLDLALTECALGNAPRAEMLFKSIEERFGATPGLQELLAQLRAPGCTGWKPRRQWNLTLARGSDRNVNQGASSQGFLIPGSQIEIPLGSDSLPQADRYKLLAVDASGDLSKNGRTGFVQLQARRNDHLHQYDSNALFGGLEQPWSVGSWSMGGSAMLGLLTLGGRLYQKVGQVALRATPPLDLPPGLKLNLVASLTHFKYPTLSTYASNTAEMRGQLSYRSDALQAQASLGFLSDRALAGRIGGNRHGQMAALQARAPLGGGVAGELGWTRQTWRGQTPFELVVQFNVREQATETFRAGLSAQIAPQQSLNLEWRRVKNRDNIPFYQYSNHVMQLGWHWHGL